MELEDQKWLPSPIRDGLTDYLSFMAEQSPLPFRGFARKLDDAMRRCRTTTIIELGSGGGGPALAIARELKRLGTQSVRLVLTDLYPNVARLQFAKAKSEVPTDVISDPIDAATVPDSFAGFRLMCNAFHHLPPDIARNCLADAVRKHQGIGVS